jgi:hypothetical protein
MRAHALRSLVLAVLTVPALAACSGGDGGAGAAGEGSGTASQASQSESQETAEWRAALEEELGTDTFDFAALQQAAAADCARTDAAAWTVELALSGDLSTSALTRVGLEHACADVVPAFDEAVATVEQAADPLDLVCGPGVELPAEAALTADLVCANR